MKLSSSHWSLVLGPWSLVHHQKQATKQRFIDYELIWGGAPTNDYGQMTNAEGRPDQGLNKTWAGKLLMIFVWITTLACLSSCGTYTFSGVAIDDSKVKTISIDNFYNDSGGGPPNMSQLFTEQIKDYYQQNTRLALVPENGDLQLEGAITGYEFVPVAARSSGSSEVADVASEMRLNITVEATYINTTDDQYDFESRDFTFFADFDADRDPSAIENELIDQIFEQIIFDIFTASVANW